MRTTLDIEEDVLQAAKELARQEERTVGQVLSDLARRGLTASVRTKKSRPVLRGGVPVLPSRGKIITQAHIQRLRDEEGI